jgi:hypothetical protein
MAAAETHTRAATPAANGTTAKKERKPRVAKVPDLRSTALKFAEMLDALDVTDPSGDTGNRALAMAQMLRLKQTKIAGT